MGGTFDEDLEKMFLDQTDSLIEASRSSADCIRHADQFFQQVAALTQQCKLRIRDRIDQWGYHIPDDVLASIFIHLDLASLGTATRVCRTWSRIATSEEVLSTFLTQMFPGVGVDPRLKYLTYPARLRQLCTEAREVAKAQVFPHVISSGEKKGNWVMCVDLNVEEDKVAFGLDDGRIFVLGFEEVVNSPISVSSVNELWFTDLHPSVLEGHDGRVNAILIRGEVLFSGGRDTTVREWDLRTSTCVQIYNGHTDWVLSLCYHDDLNLIMSSSDDGTLRLWDRATGIQQEPFTLRTPIQVLRYHVQRDTMYLGTNRGLFEYHKFTPMLAPGAARADANRSVSASGLGGIVYDIQIVDTPDWEGEVVIVATDRFSHGHVSATRHRSICWLGDTRSLAVGPLRNQRGFVEWTLWGGQGGGQGRPEGFHPGDADSGITCVTSKREIHTGELYFPRMYKEVSSQGKFYGETDIVRCLISTPGWLISASHSGLVVVWKYPGPHPPS